MVSIKRINPDAFRPYGQVIQAPDEPATAESAMFRFWSDLAHYGIEGETEIGLCTVYRQEVPVISWMERHERTPEILVPIDSPVLLPVMPPEGGPESVVLFEIHPGEAVVIADNVWHSACLPVRGAEATYFVIFRRGTPQEDVIKTELANLTF